MTMENDLISSASETASSVYGFKSPSKTDFLAAATRNISDYDGANGEDLLQMDAVTMQQYLLSPNAPLDGSYMTNDRTPLSNRDIVMKIRHSIEEGTKFGMMSPNAEDFYSRLSNGDYSGAAEVAKKSGFDNLSGTMITRFVDRKLGDFTYETFDSIKSRMSEEDVSQAEALFSKLEDQANESAKWHKVVEDEENNNHYYEHGHRIYRPSYYEAIEKYTEADGKISKIKESLRGIRGKYVSLEEENDVISQFIQKDRKENAWRFEKAVMPALSEDGRALLMIASDFFDEPENFFERISKRDSMQIYSPVIPSDEAIQDFLRTKAFEEAFLALPREEQKLIGPILAMKKFDGRTYVEDFVASLFDPIGDAIEGVGITVKDLAPAPVKRLFGYTKEDVAKERMDRIMVEDYIRSSISDEWGLVGNSLNVAASTVGYMATVAIPAALGSYLGGMAGGVPGAAAGAKIGATIGHGARIAGFMEDIKTQTARDGGDTIDPDFETFCFAAACVMDAIESMHIKGFKKKPVNTRMIYRLWRQSGGDFVKFAIRTLISYGKDNLEEIAQNAVQESAVDFGTEEISAARVDAALRGAAKGAVEQASDPLLYLGFAPITLASTAYNMNRYAKSKTLLDIDDSIAAGIALDNVVSTLENPEISSEEKLSQARRFGISYGAVFDYLFNRRGNEFKKAFKEVGFGLITEQKLEEYKNREKEISRIKDFRERVSETDKLKNDINNTSNESVSAALEKLKRAISATGENTELKDALLGGHLKSGEEVVSEYISKSPDNKLEELVYSTNLGRKFTLLNIGGTYAMISFGNKTGVVDVSNESDGNVNSIVAGYNKWVRKTGKNNGYTEITKKEWLNTSIENRQILVDNAGLREEGSFTPTGWKVFDPESGLFVDFDKEKNQNLLNIITGEINTIGVEGTSTAFHEVTHLFVDILKNNVRMGNENAKSFLSALVDAFPSSGDKIGLDEEALAMHMEDYFTSEALQKKGVKLFERTDKNNWLIDRIAKFFGFMKKVDSTAEERGNRFTVKDPQTMQDALVNALLTGEMNVPEAVRRDNANKTEEKKNGNEENLENANQSQGDAVHEPQTVKPDTRNGIKLPTFYESLQDAMVSSREELSAQEGVQTDSRSRLEKSLDFVFAYTAQGETETSPSTGENDVLRNRIENQELGNAQVEEDTTSSKISGVADSVAGEFGGTVAEDSISSEGDPCKTIILPMASSPNVISKATNAVIQYGGKIGARPIRMTSVKDGAFANVAKDSKSSRLIVKFEDRETAQFDIVTENGKRMSVSFNDENDVLGEARAVYDAWHNEDGTAKPGYLLAPNGEPTNLSEEQWIRVRTNAFKFAHYVDGMVSPSFFGAWDLKFKDINVVEGEKAAFSKASEALKWVKENGVTGTMTNEETRGKGEISISNASVHEMLNGRQVRKSANNEVHYAALMKIRDIIRESEITDVHDDFLKKDGIRNPENGTNPNVLIEVLHGAFRLDGKLYRVKTTLKKYADENRQKKAYAYNVEKIEVTGDKQLVSQKAAIWTSMTSIPATILLDGVRNVNGKLALSDHSVVVDENGEPLVVYHGTDAEFNVFDMTKGRSKMDIQGSFFSPYEVDASGYGRNVGAFYLTIRNPADGSTAYRALNRFKGKNNAGVKAREYLQSLGYDGVYNGYDEYIAFEPAQIKSATDNVGTFSGDPDTRFSISPADYKPEKTYHDIKESMPSNGQLQPWPENFPKVMIQTNLDSVNKKWPELHDRAKHGSREAALELVRNIIGEERVGKKVNQHWEKIRAMSAAHPNAILVPVHAEEATGRNQIPTMYATMIETITGLSICTDIVQTVRANHTGANAVDRMMRRAAYDGPVVRGAEYILVDDHVTQGGTLNELRKFIQSHGGKVVAATSLTASQYSTTIAISNDAIKALYAKFGNDLDEKLQQAGIANGVAELTQSEARELRKLLPDTLRDRIAQARLARQRELGPRAARSDEERREIRGETGNTRFSISALNDGVSRDIQSLYIQSAQNIPSLKDIANRVCARLDGGSVYFRLPNRAEDDLQVDSRENIVGKANRLYGGDVTQVADIISAKLTLSQDDSYLDAIRDVDEIASEYAAYIARVEPFIDDFESGVRATIRFDNGGLGELLLSGPGEMRQSASEEQPTNIDAVNRPASIPDEAMNASLNASPSVEEKGSLAINPKASVETVELGDIAAATQNLIGDVPYASALFTGFYTNYEGEPRKSVSSLLESTGITYRELDPDHIDSASPIEFTLPDGTVWTDKNQLTPEMILSGDNQVSLLIRIAREELPEGEKPDEQEAYEIASVMAKLANKSIEIGTSSEDGKFYADIVDTVWRWHASDAFKAVKKNADRQYGKSIDILTICKKTEQLMAVVSDWQKRNKRGATIFDMMRLYFSVGVNGFQTPCPFCYVFSRWLTKGMQYESINSAQVRYAAYITRPDNLSAQPESVRKYWEGTESQKADFWKKELSAAEKRESSKAVDKAKKELNDLRETFDKIVIAKMAKMRETRGGSSLSQAEVTNILGEVESYKDRYFAAYRVVANSNVSAFIKTVILTKNGTLAKFQPIPQDILFDYFRTHEIKKDYTRIWSYLNSFGSAAGKAIEDEANNPFGDAICALSVNDPAKSKNYLLPCFSSDVMPEAGDTEEKKKDKLKLRKKRINDFKKRFRAAMQNTTKQSVKGGTRALSWSDWKYDTELDYLMIALQLQLLRSPMQSYTKQLEGAEVFGLIGQSTNISLVPSGEGCVESSKDDPEAVEIKVYDKEGNEIGTKFFRPTFSNTMGANEKEARNLSALHDSVGNITIGVNDTQVRTILASQHHFFCIGYHASGLAKLILKSMRMFLGDSAIEKLYTDYSGIEEEHVLTDSVLDVVRDIWEKKNFFSKYGSYLSRDKFLDGDKKKVSKEQLRYRDLYNRCITDPKSIFESQKDYSDVQKDYFLKRTLDLHWEYNNAGKVVWLPGSKSDVTTIYPSQYWDETSTFETADVNGDAYLEWCRRIGYVPKYAGVKSNGPLNKDDRSAGNFIWDSGYWKLLIDRRMYDRNGKYRENSSINLKRLLTPFEYTDSSGSINHVDYFDKDSIAKRWERNVGGKIVNTVTTPPNREESVIRKISEGADDLGEGVDLSYRDENGDVVDPAAEGDIDEIFEALAGETRHSFIYEEGARNLDASDGTNDRIEKLNIAKDRINALLKSNPADKESYQKEIESIFNETGWFIWPDGKYRYVLDSKDLDVADIEKFKSLPDEKRTLENLFVGGKFAHDLFTAYPYLRGVKFEDSYVDLGSGGYSLNTGVIEVKNYSDLVKDNMPSEMLMHELQHVIQHLGELTINTGGNPSKLNVSRFAPNYNRVDKVKRMIAHKSHFGDTTGLTVYRFLGGDVEANLAAYMRKRTKAFPLDETNMKNLRYKIENTLQKGTKTLVPIFLREIEYKHDSASVNKAEKLYRKTLDLYLTRLTSSDVYFSISGQNYSPSSNIGFATALLARDIALGYDKPDESYADILTSIGAIGDNSGLTVGDIRRYANGLLDNMGEQAKDVARKSLKNLANDADKSLVDTLVGRMVAGLGRSSIRLGGRAEKAFAKAMANIMKAEMGKDAQDLKNETGIDIAELIMEVDSQKHDQSGSFTNPKQQNESTDSESEDAGNDKVGIPGFDEIDLRSRAEKLEAEILARRERILTKLKELREKLADSNQGQINIDRDIDEDLDDEKDPVGVEAKKDEAARNTVGYKDFIESLKKDGIDVSDVDELGAFLQIWVEDFCGGPIKSDVNPDRFVKYKRTMRQVLRYAANSLIDVEAERGGRAIRRIERTISDIETAKTVGEAQRYVRSVLGQIQRAKIRFTRNDLVKKLREEIKARAIRGKKFDALEKDLKRKLRGSEEKKARYVYRILDWSDEKIAQEKKDLWNIVSGRKDAYEKELDEELSTDNLSSTDAEVHDAIIKTNCLEKWGGLKRMTLSEIKAKGREILKWLDKESVEHDKIWEKWSSANDRLANAVQSMAKRNRKLAPGETWMTGLTDQMVSTVRQRLEKFFVGADYESSKGLVDEIMEIISGGSQALAVIKKRFADEHMNMLEQAVKGTGKSVNDLLKELDQICPAELNERLVTEAQNPTMTWGQVMQLYASLCQEQSYRDNIIKNGREGQKELIESYLTERPELLRLVSAMRSVYTARRAELSAMMESVCGMPMLSPDPLYMPVKMYNGPREGYDSQISVWNPFGKWASPRIKNDKDFDLTASIANMFSARSNDAAKSLAWGVRGMQLRSIFGRSETQQVLLNNNSKMEVNSFMQQLTDVVSDGFRTAPLGELGKLATAIGNVSTYSALSWNLCSMLKQMAALPAWASVLDDGVGVVGKMLQYIVSFDINAAKELMETDGFVARYGASNVKEMFLESFRDKTSSGLVRFYKAGMNVLQLGDVFAAMTVGTGLYKALKEKYIRDGMDEASAKEKAATKVWACVEESQQSSRVENMNDWMRRHGLLARSIMKFATSPLLQLSHEVHAGRMMIEARADGNEDAARRWRRRFVNQIVCNHVVLPALMMLFAEIFNHTLGNEPPEDEEWIAELILSCLVGPFGRVFLLGLICEEGGKFALKLIGLKPPMFDSSATPTNAMIKRIGDMIGRMGADLAEGDFESFRDDVLDGISLGLQPARYAISAAQNYSGYDKRKARASRKREIKKRESEK